MAVKRIPHRSVHWNESLRVIHAVIRSTVTVMSYLWTTVNFRLPSRWSRLYKLRGCWQLHLEMSLSSLSLAFNSSLRSTAIFCSSHHSRISAVKIRV